MDKFILKSKTILAGLLMLLPVLAQWFGFSFTGDEAALLSEGWDKVLQVVAFVGVLIGRWQAGGISIPFFGSK